MALINKPLIQCGFIVLCPDRNYRHLLYTVKTIQPYYKGSPIICVTESDATEEELKELNRIVPTLEGGKTFSSLINCGFENTTGWNFLVMAGSTMQGNLDIKMSRFIGGDKDILFPIANRKTSFHEGTINGLLLRSETFKEVGPWDSNLPLETCKLLWANDAIDLGCQFKAVMGTKIC